mmetsp:Transcript_4239/g.8597  ORF Transcript_4239/g.8597 Transcript_4239/m.8597 type:complete len:431 (-) Transcript_4239:240-1532(-)
MWPARRRAGQAARARDATLVSGAACAKTAALLALTVQGVRHRRRPLKALGRTACHYSTSSLHQPAALGRLDVPVLRPPLSGMQGSLLVDVDKAVDFLPGLASLGQTQPISVVDCGSGSTRGIHFSEARGVEGLPMLRKRKSAWRGDPLALALQDEAKTAGLVDLLAQQLPSGLVLVGATAGIRNALDTGVLTREQLGAFSRRLRAGLGERASFDVLSGVGEGKAEWEAVAHELSAHPGAGRLKFEDCAGMLSGGGMSCQLAVKGKGAEEAAVFSFGNSVLTPGGLVDRAAQGSLTGRELFEGLRAHEAAVAEKVSRLPRSLSGTFALIEWVGFYVAGEPTARDLPMGLGYERPLSRHEILDALERHLQALRPQRGDVIVPRPVAVSLVYGTVLRALLRGVFDDAATFYCLSGVSWAMGHYLRSRRSACYF